MRCEMLAEEKLLLLKEKNLVMLNLLRDVMENEVSIHILPDGSGDAAIERAVHDRASRKKEILGEIEDLLYREYIMSQIEA